MAVALERLSCDNHWDMVVYTMMFCCRCCCYVYRFVTLEPGDMVLTGTPPGVGCFRKPPLYLKVSVLMCLVCVYVCVGEFSVFYVCMCAVVYTEYECKHGVSMCM